MTREEAAAPPKARCECGRPALPKAEYLDMCEPCFFGEPGERLGAPDKDGHQ